MVATVPNTKAAPSSVWVAVIAWSENEKVARSRRMFVTGANLTEAYHAAVKEGKARDVVVGIGMATFLP